MYMYTVHVCVCVYMCIHACAYVCYSIIYNIFIGTSDDVSDKIKQLRAVISDVVYDNFAILHTQLKPQSTLEYFAEHLLVARIITEDIAYKPTYKDIIHCFLATLPVLKTTDAIQVHCQKFIQALDALGSSGAIGASEALRDGWRKAADKIGHDNFLSGMAGY